MTHTTPPEGALEIPSWARPGDSQEARTWVVGEPVSHGVHELAWAADGLHPADAEVEEAPEPEEQDCPRCDATREEAAAEHGRVADETREALAASTATFREAIETLNGRVNQDILRLSELIASRVLEVAVRLQPELATEQLSRAFAAAGPLVQVVVRTHPEQVSAMRQAAPDLAAEVAGQAVDVVVQGDAQMMLGGVELVFEEGRVDATFESALERLGEVLTDIVALPALDDAVTLDDSGEDV